MSTRAVIDVGDKTFFCQSDGYPSCVVDEFLIPLIEESKEKDKRNPDFSFHHILQDLMREDFDEFWGDSCDYIYKVDKEGNITYRKSSERIMKDANLREWENEN